MAKDANQNLPYWKLSGFYFFYFASLGIMLPYWNPYLYERGFSATEIGYLTAIIAFTKIFAPYIWGWFADHIDNRMKVIQIASLACLLIFPCVLLVDDILWMSVVILAFSFFWNASLPQFEATTLSHLDEQTERYSQVRLWGSIGFIVAVLLAGYLLGYLGIRFQPWLVLLIFAAVFISSLFVKNKNSQPVYALQASFIQQLKNSSIILLFVLCFLMQFSHGAYYTFYSIYLQEHGYSESLTGFLWALGVFAEIFVFIFMHRLIGKYKASSLLACCFILATLRWLVMSFAVNQLVLMLLIQLLHAFSFGMFHAVAIYLIHLHFPGNHQGRAQALYSASSYGLGGALGAILSGYLWSVSTGLTFLLMAFAAFVGIFLSLIIKPLESQMVIAKQ